MVIGMSNDDRPSWSPDGGSLAFVSDRDWGDRDVGKPTGAVGIFIVTPDGAVINLQRWAHTVLAPTWGNR
jgi:Tol biopolymer transport system component